MLDNISRYDSLPEGTVYVLFSPTREQLCFHGRHQGDTCYYVGHEVGNLATASDTRTGGKGRNMNR